MISENQIIRLIFGFKVRFLRQQKELSYQELSQLTGLSTSYLNDIEKGKRYPKTGKITALAGALGVDYNYLVATNASKQLQPVIDLFNSNFFKLFPLDEFGISTEKALELFIQTPEKVSSFISTILRLARNYQVDEEEFYKEALRSYQDMHNNHFPELEAACQEFKAYYSLPTALSWTPALLEEQLQEVYAIQVDRSQLASQTHLTSIRSYFQAKTKTLHLQAGLSEAQQNFLLAREIGFQYLKLEVRPYETTIINIDSFDKLLNNYKASHFAAALLMDEQELANDIRQLARENSWKPQLMLDLLTKYRVTPEMLLQRLTNILPHHLGIEDLFFLRLTASPDLKTYRMTKDLHLSQFHNPYNNELKEHFCHRWVSISSIKAQRMGQKGKQAHIVADSQISKYWQTDKEYLCLSFAKPGFSPPGSAVSVTIGLLVTPHLKSIFHFLSDPKLKVREVHTTCERCGIIDCEARVAPPFILEEAEKSQEMFASLSELP